MQDTRYYLNECPQKPNCFYCTARTHNTGVERGHLQYNIDPNILKQNTINYIEDENIVFEENTEENLKKLLPKTNKNNNFNDWQLLLVVWLGGDNNWIKGALLNKTTNLLALMTSSKGKDRIIDNGNRAIPSYNSEWFIGHYRLVAPAKFWHELIRRLNTNVCDGREGGEGGEGGGEEDGGGEGGNKHVWTEEETKTICQLYIENKTYQEIATKLPNVKLSSIKMKYSNCVYLDKGNGSSNNVSKLHSKVWHEIKKTIIINHVKSTKLPKIKKQEIWSKYIGLIIGTDKCLCCNLNDITQFEFHSGHIIPKSKGGDCSIENLRPICSLCNSSMSDKNMIEFMDLCNYDKTRMNFPEPIVKTVENKKVVIKCKMRNNQWGKHFNVFDTIVNTKKVVCPWGHWKDTNNLFNEGKFRNEKFSNIFINDISCNDLVCIFDREYDYGLIVKIISEPITEKLNEIIIVRNNKCSHKPMIYNCTKCNESVELVFTDKYYNENSKSFIKYLNEDYHFENMYAIIRNIKVIGKVNDNCTFYTIGKRLQSSICHSNEELLHTYIYDDLEEKNDLQKEVDKIKKYKDKIVKEPIITMLAHTSGRMNH